MSKKRSRAARDLDRAILVPASSLSTTALSKAVEAFVPSVVDQPEVFLGHGAQIASQILDTTKSLYDFGMQWRPISVDLSSTLTELVTEGLDEEQIWEELQLHNEPLLSHMESLVEKLSKAESVGFEELIARLEPKAKKQKLKHRENESDEELKGDAMEVEDSFEGEDSLAERSFEFDGDDEDGKILERDAEDDDDELFEMDADNNSNSDENGDEGEQGEGKAKEGDEDEDSEIDLFRTGTKKPPVTEGVDLPPDPFYDEDFLDEFVEQAELEEEGVETLKVDSDDEERAMALLYGGEDDDGDQAEGASNEEEGASEDGTGFKGLDAEGLDATELALERALDRHLAEEGDEEVAEGRGRKKGGKKGDRFDAKTAKYSDWPDDAEENLRDDFEGDIDAKTLSKQLSKFEREQEKMRSAISEGQRLNLLGDEGEGEDDELLAKQATLSKYEKKAEQLRKKIARIEEEQLGDKSWQMLGEASAAKRPANSLLEEDLEFDFAARPAPVVTEAVTKTIEDLIKYRIFHEAFDDAVARQREDEKGDYRERAAELDSTKSKKSLAEVYEDEYNQKTQGVEKDDPKAELKDEIARLFKAIVFKLDALAHSQSAPRKTKEELEIRTLKPDVSAIAMEEVTPIAVSDAARLAPEEIFAKKESAPKGEAEYTREERRKVRRDKKGAKKKATEQKEEQKKRRVALKEATMSEEEKRRRDEAREGKAQGSVAQAIKQIKDSGAKNVNFAAGVDTTQYAKSTALFEKLQSEAQREAQGLRDKKAGKQGAGNKGPGNSVLKYRL